MTLTHKEATLEEIRDILLRIERILTREADNATVGYYVRKLSQPRPVPLPGMPDPPIAPVMPQTVWQRGTAYVGSAKTDALPQWTTPPASYSHGGWIHATGFSMVGP